LESAIRAVDPGKVVLVHMSLANQPRISVIILSYKKFEQTTSACLRSLVLDPQFPTWEVVIVDNDSGPETRSAIAVFNEEFPAVRLVLNETNLGFAGGMNSGLRAAGGDVICLLNSDTVIAQGAIGRLAANLWSDSTLGMAGPVTNEAGNEQKIFVSDRNSVESILNEGTRYANCGSSGRILAYRLDFCAVALKREVYEAIGGLDEGFGRGYYEDFDYSLLARKAGFELAVAEDAFVYHQGSASFGSVNKETKVLIAANKRRVIERHGADTIFPHLRDANLSVLRQYVDQLQAGLPPPTLRIRNRFALAAAERPRSPFKRWRYMRKFDLIASRLRLAPDSA
jgi:GT2 family glycosyltransferase